MGEEAALKRIDEIEEEIKLLKQDLSTGKKTSLKGLWKDTQFTEEDFEDAEQSLFPHAA